MADELNETKEEIKVKTEVTEEITPEEEKKLLEEVNKEIDKKIIENVEKIINPPEKEEEEDKEKKTAEDTEEDKKQGTEVEEDSTKTEDDSKTTKTLADLNLPNRLIQAAKRNKVSDEEVVKLGDKVELYLAKLADKDDSVSEYLGKIGREAKSKTVSTKKEEVKPPTLNFPEEFDSDVANELKAAIDAQNAQITELKNQLTNQNTQSTKTAELEAEKKIDSIFDKVSEVYSEFGKTETLTNAELVMRQNVWETADNIMAGAILNHQTVTLEDALDQAMSIYEGKHPTKAREKIVKEVKEREKQIIHRPTSKKTVQIPEGNDKEAIKAVNDWLNRGKDGWND